jgi:NAD(P)-dependent dehydrogenase (short-subunit alcohol dehydrogenase family)
MPANGRKSIFITGAASGIGRATARKFAAGGWFVGAFDVNADGLAALKAELGAGNVFTRTLDVADRADYARAIEAFAAETGGTMDVLFNNAGIGRGGPFDEMPWEDVLAVVNVNFIGVMNGIHLAMPLLKATPNALCFTTSSSSATFGIPGIAVYSATKHAVKGLTEALSVEFKRYGIRAADTLPGLIDTAILPPEAKTNAPKDGMFRLIQPTEVAEAVWAAYATDKIHWYVPEDIFELDKMATLAPEATREQMAATTGFIANAGNAAG